MLTLFLVGGVAGLWLGGEAFVHGSVVIAQRLRVSQLVIGLTLVGFGTSLPELVTSLTAALDGSPGLAVGNVVGSNIANVLLILGITAAIRRVVCEPDAFFRDSIALAAATAVGTVLIVTGEIGRGAGIVLTVGIVAYLVLVFAQERRGSGPASDVFVHEAELAESIFHSMPLAAASVVVGLAAVIGGAWLMVAGAIELAGLWGVSETLIGLTIVAIGTSLPELVISAIASLRGRSDVALGNIMGSNMFNTLAILGITATVTPIAVPPDLSVLDVVTMVVATMLLIVTAAVRMSVSRLQGGFFLTAYVVYMALRSAVGS